MMTKANRTIEDTLLDDEDDDNRTFGNGLDPEEEEVLEELGFSPRSRSTSPFRLLDEDLISVRGPPMLWSARLGVVALLRLHV